MENRVRHPGVFGLALAFGAGGLSLAAAAVVTAAVSVHHQSSGTGQIVLSGLHFTYPTVNGPAALLLLLGFLGVVVIKRVLGSTWRQCRAYRAFTAHLGPVESLERAPGVKVILDSRPQAFCAGYLRPSVYLSRRTVDLLTHAQLEAVLAHEHHHRQVRDPLRLACGRILTEALFFVPVLKSLADRYSDVAELRADQAAVRASAGREASLASALLAFDESGPPGVTGISPERVDALLGQPTHWRPPAWLLAGSLGILSASSLLIWGVSGIASAHATFNVPILSSRPCVVMMMTALPFVGCTRRLAQGARRPGTALARTERRRLHPWRHPLGRGC